MTGRTRYTKITANEILPEVIRHLQALREATILAEQHEKEAIKSAPTNGGTDDPSHWAKASKQRAEHLEWFSEAGILIKSLETGLIDFPAQIEGNEVLLCWKEGEERIEWWHTYEDGFPGRRPL